MRIVYIAAGAAGSYCGACNRDVALIRELSAMGHQMVTIPLYTPLRTDGPDPSSTGIFYGGVNAYLEQHVSLFRRSLGFVDRILNSSWLLRLVSHIAIETQPSELGEMTVSVLLGLEGHQRKEADRLLSFLEDSMRPDVVNLSNSLLSAVAPEIKRRLGVPVVCALQGEDVFVNGLGEPHSRQAIDLIRQHAEHIDLFFSPGERYADEMSNFLAVPRERIRVVRPGVDTQIYAASNRSAETEFRIGFLSRIAPVKGFDLMVDAFIRIERERPGNAVLCAAGAARGSNAKYLKRLEKRIRNAGLQDRFEYWGEVTLEKKIEFLSRCSVFSVPSRNLEQDGIACLEALACGVPVVAPQAGQLPEIIDVTRGGSLVPPDDAEALARTIMDLQQDRDKAQAMGLRAAEAVRQQFSARQMASETVKAYEDVLSASSRAAFAGPSA